MNILALTAGLLGMLVYVPTIVQLWRGRLKVNGTTFLLWGILDVIVGFFILLKGGGNWFLPIGYSVMCFAVLAVIFVRLGTFTWGVVDTIVTIAAAVSMVVWANAGPIWATVASTIGVVIACIPQGIDMWRKPQEATIWMWVAFLFANGLSTVAGKDWSITERFFPGMCSIATLVLVLLAIRKLGLKPAVAH